MQRYESYKPSGVEWLGDIPESWDVCRNIGLFDERKEINQLDMELLSVTINRGVIRQEEITEKKDSSNEDKSKYKVVRKDDLAYNKMRMWQGAIGRSEYEGIVSPAYVILAPRDNLYSRYYHYLYRTEAFISEANRHSYGLCLDMNSLRYEDFKTIYSPVPPRTAAERIVAFLDQKTAEIDAAIVKKERLIEVLTEQRQTLINQAVTAGLDQTVPQHYSGVEWIGDIPSGWGVVPVTKYTKSIVDYRGKTPEKVESGVFLVTAKNIKKGQIDYAASTEFVTEKDYPKIMARGLPEIGDLLFTTEAPLGEVALVDRTDVAFAQRIIKLRLDRDRLLPKFVVYAMSARYFRALLAREATGSTALGIKASKLHKLKIAAPSLGEQNRIVEYLDGAGAKIQELQSRIQGEIQNLRELKTNTVASCVTGLFKV